MKKMTPVSLHFELPIPVFFLHRKIRQNLVRFIVPIPFAIFENIWYKYRSKVGVRSGNLPSLLIALFIWEGANDKYQYSVLKKSIFFYKNDCVY